MVVPSVIVETAVVFNTGFDVGACIAVGAADDRTVGAYSKAVNLNGVKTTAVVLETDDVAVGSGLGQEDTSIGGNHIFLGEREGGRVPINDGDDVMDTGVEEAGVGENIGHVVAKVELNFVGRRNGPLIRSVLDIAFTHLESGTAHINAGRVYRADGNSTAGLGCGYAVEGKHSGRRKENPVVGVFGEVKSYQHTIGIGGHSIEQFFVARSNGEVDAGSVTAKAGTTAGDIDNS